jgi:predicted metal-dependent phosphotriesterase family hydrolase
VGSWKNYYIFILFSQFSYRYSSPYNVKLDDFDTKEVILDEILRFKEAGGKTIVENTVHGISRNNELLQDLSKRSGINIVAGTGPI